MGWYKRLPHCPGLVAVSRLALVRGSPQQPLHCYLAAAHKHRDLFPRAAGSPMRQVRNPRIASHAWRGGPLLGDGVGR